MSRITSPNPHVHALLSHVTVLTPEQVAAKVVPMRQEASVMNGYAFGLQLPNAIVRDLKEQNALSNIRLSINSSPRGIAVLCVTLQIAGTQIRTVCNGNQKGVQRWLSCLMLSGHANWLLNIEGGRQVAWVSKELQIPDPYKLLASLYEAEHLDSHEETLEMGTVAAQLSALDAVTSLIPGVELDTLVMGLQFPGALAGQHD